ncbi:MAG: RHS repeat-associated core domain-containing protein, partial [Verrucomicrobiota bacterium]
MKTYLLLGMLLVFGAASTFADNGFTGQASDASKAYYLRARYYDPETGTFLSKDPMGVAAGPNSYQYVANNPINNIDPLGLFTWWDYVAQSGSLIGGGVTVVGGGAALLGGGATFETGAGAAVAVGGWYLVGQGSASFS